MQAVENETLGDLTVEWHGGAAACVILASGGYPGSYEKGTTAPATEPPAGATVIDLMDPEGVNKALGIMPLE